MSGREGSLCTVLFQIGMGEIPPTSLLLPTAPSPFPSLSWPRFDLIHLSGDLATARMQAPRRSSSGSASKTAGGGVRGGAESDEEVIHVSMCSGAAYHGSLHVGTYVSSSFAACANKANFHIISG